MDNASCNSQHGHRMHTFCSHRAYHAEVPLKFTYNTGRYDLVIEGRADGILDKFFNETSYDAQESLFESGKELPLIDEIKGTYRDLKKMKEPVEVHLAQAKCYAAIYLVFLARIQVRR